MKSLLALPKYRGYIWRNAVNDIRYRYAGSGMGVFWNVINPALQILIFGAVFGVILSPSSLGRGERWIHLCLGLLPWLGFCEALVRANHSLVRGGGLVRMAAVPQEVLVAESALSSAFSSQIAIGLLIVGTLLAGMKPHAGLLLLPLASLLFSAFAYGLGLILACLSVFLMDTAEVLRVLLQIWMWTMPIVYAESVLGGAFRPWLNLNPPYVYIREIRALGLGEAGLEPLTWLLMAGWAMAAVGIGILVSNRLRSDVLDVV
jgi:lipopolysaccharide transport system permease protein